MYSKPLGGKSIFFPLLVFQKENLHQPSARGHLFMTMVAFGACC